MRTIYPTSIVVIFGMLIIQYCYAGELAPPVSSPADSTSELSRIIPRTWAIYCDDPTMSSFVSRLRKMGISWEWLGEYSRPKDIVIPPELRWVSTKPKPLVDAIASYNGLSVYWANNSHLALVYRPVDPILFKEIENKLQSENVGEHTNGFLLGGWLADPRLIEPMLTSLDLGKQSNISPEYELAFRRFGVSAMAEYSPQTVVPLLKQQAFWTSDAKLNSMYALLNAERVPSEVLKSKLSSKDSNLKTSFCYLVDDRKDTDDSIVDILTTMATKDEDKTVREVALSVLAHMSTPHAMAQIAQIENQMPNQLNLLVALARQGDQDAIETLLARVRDTTPANVAYLQSNLPYCVTERVLAELVESQAPGLREIASLRIATMQDEAAERNFARFMHDDDPVVQENAINGISSFNTPGIIRMLTDALKDDRWRRSAAISLAKIGSDQALDVLRRNLKTSESKDQIILWRVGTIVGGNTGIGFLRQALEGDNATRTRFVLLDSQCGDAAIPFEFVAELAGEHSDWKREVAALQLRRFGSLRVALLKKLLSDSVPEVRSAAADTWGSVDPQIGDAEYRRLLTTEKDAGVRQAVISGLLDRPLYGYSQDSGKEIFIQLTEDPDSQIRCSACDALRQISGKDVVSSLLKCLGDEDPQVRIAALAASDLDAAASKVALLKRLELERNANVLNALQKKLSANYKNDEDVKAALSKMHANASIDTDEF